jgi:hypothetical protein
MSGVKNTAIKKGLKEDKKAIAAAERKYKILSFRLN